MQSDNNFVLFVFKQQDFLVLLSIAQDIVFRSLYRNVDHNATIESTNQYKIDLKG